MSRCSPKESRGPPASGSIKGLFFLYSPPPPPHCRSPVGLNAYCFSTREGESRAGLKCPACLFCTKLFSLEKLTEKKVPVINKLETVFPSTPRQHLSDRLLLLSATDKTYQKTQQSLIFASCSREFFLKDSVSPDPPYVMSLRGAPRSVQWF